MNYFFQLSPWNLLWAYTFSLLMLDLLMRLPTTDATVALEQLSYTVDEDDGIATVCYCF